MRPETYAKIPARYRHKIRYGGLTTDEVLEVADAISGDPADAQAKADAAVASLRGPNEASLAIAPVRVGTPNHPVNLQPAIAGAPMTVAVPTVSHPAISTIAGWRPIGKTPAGELIIRAVDGYTLRLSFDGFATYRTVKANVPVELIWFDAGGNAYAANARVVYRAPAGSWFFSQCFQFAAVNGVCAPYSYTVDDRGGIFVAEYCTTDAETGQQVWRSTDYGVTWASINVDVGQRHHHGIYWHESTDHLYLFAGEPHGGDSDTNHGRKLMRSTDRGATFATVFSFGTSSDLETANSNPTSFINDGNFFLLGADGGAYAGFWLCDARTPTATPVKIPLRAECYQLATNGYYYQLSRDANGSIVAPPEYNGTATSCVRPLIIQRNRNSIPVAVISPYVSRQNSSSQVFGPDKAGNMAVLQKDGSTLILPKCDVSSRVGYCTLSNRGFLTSLSWDSHADVVAGASFGGHPILLINHGDPGSAPSPNSVTVTAGKKYRLVTAVKRGTGSAVNLMREVVWFQGESFLSVTQEVINMTQSPVGEWVRVIGKLITAPANADNCKVYYKNYINPTDAHHISARTTVYEATAAELNPGSNDLPWIPNAIASEQYTATFSFGADSVFVDRIYSQCPPSLLPRDVSIPLLTIGSVEIGVKAKTGAAAGDYHHYVKISGVETEALGPMWGSQTERPLLVTIASEADDKSIVRGLSAPLLVAITASAVLIVNPETGALETYPVATSGSVTVTMAGTAVHVPKFVPSAASYTAEQVARLFP